MVRQNLVTEEAWYALYTSSWLQSAGEMQEFILETYPDATEEQMTKAIGVLQEAILKKAKYE